MEAGANTWAVADLLKAHAGRVVVANPYKTKLIAEAQIKNDKVDAGILARLLAARFICDVWIPDTPVREQRALAAHRATLQKQCTRIKNRPPISCSLRLSSPNCRSGLTASDVLICLQVLPKSSSINTCPLLGCTTWLILLRLGGAMDACAFNLHNLHQT